MSKAKQKRAKRLGFCGKKSKDGQQSNGGKKDPGIPNVRSFKEHSQRQAELRKQRLEEQQERQRLSREKEMMKRRSLDSFQKDIQLRQRDFEQREIQMQNLEKHVKFETENSRKAYGREFKKVIEAADVILEVLDARDPLGCRCPQVEQAVVQSGTNKKIVLVLNKIDLVSKEIVEKWIKYLRNEFPTVTFKSSTQQQNKHLKRSRVPVTQATQELLESSACVGADCLMKLLGNYCRNQDIKTAISVGVVGFPNVGKSSLINSLKRSRACNVGATPGVTKCLQEVHLDKYIKLLDCPGIVMATSTSDAAMILRNCVKIEQLMDPIPPVEAILRRCNKAQIMDHYEIPDFQTAHEFLALLARRQGKLRKGGLPDSDKAAKSVLMDWTMCKTTLDPMTLWISWINTDVFQNIFLCVSQKKEWHKRGRISYFTHPPETHTLPTHVSAEIVAEMGKAFDWDELEKGNLEALAECGASDAQMGFCMATSGLTQGQVEELAEQQMDDPSEDLELQDTVESMDADEDPEFGPMTVELKVPKTKSSTAIEAVGPKPVDLKEILDVDPLLQGQALLAANKKRKKQQKRADKLGTKLSDSLTSALNFSLSDS
ncbi:guanine nucleotide-binding protein-like 3-like protein isoform X1 [Sinocyclocheilus anshuiensis]|uniref:guanine nucleotide-binding protein-like 3-like protein isoform X1 n=1 Tax=Sinocyclocheilus anshuiensis TaxID=1608454 RepID=UPI0007BA1C9E|nr:PREDICTED: guanine nucleotide-binding protein-like 3-like protein isoform X1 [Sinocyclocheilus anshuiensis]